jgi:hypothetical protein
MVHRRHLLTFFTILDCSFSILFVHNTPATLQIPHIWTKIYFPGLEILLFPSLIFYKTKIKNHNHNMLKNHQLIYS